MAVTSPKAKTTLGAALTALVLAYYETGSEQHLNEVFRQLKSYLDKYSYSSLCILCPDKRQELVQETLIHILGRLRTRQFTHTVDENGQLSSFLPWACRVHHNLFINDTRAAKEPGRANAAEDPFLLVPVSAIAASSAAGAGFDTREDALALLGRIKEAVEALPPKMRRCFEAYYYQGLSYDQIAAAYGINKITCRGAVCKALSILTKWAAQQAERPTAAIYESLPSIDTGEEFGDPAKRNMPRGYHTRTSSQSRYYAKRALATRLAA